MDGVRDGIIWVGSLASPCPFSGASRTRFLAHMCDDVAELLIFVGRISDFEDVHVDALWRGTQNDSSVV